MTIEDGLKFVDTVILGNWPKWKFTEQAKSEWAKRLWSFDFDKAKKVITDFAFDYKKQGHPPASQIFAILHKNAKLPKEQVSSDPVLLYQIIRPDGRPAGFPTASFRGIPKDIERVQRQAEGLCKHIAGNREGFYIKWLCEAVAPSTPF